MGYRETDRMVLFNSGEFSQWYPCVFVVEKIRYCTAEQYMMAEKARLFNDRKTLRKILKTNSPVNQKAFGREVQGFEEQKWKKYCREIVYKGNLAKFSQNPALREKLLSTGKKVLVEASPSDRVWGIGRAWDDPLAEDRSAWRGTNWLGEVLMRVRRELENSR